MRRKIMYAMLVAMSALILTGTGVVGYTLYESETRDPARLYLEDGSEVVEFRELSLLPGESLEYDIDILGEPEGSCTLVLDFTEVENKNGSNDLKNYVYAKVEVEGKEICDMLLAELLETEPSKIGCVLDKKEPIDMKLTYYMPIATGNEAKNAEVLFDLAVSSSNENQ